MSTDLRQVVVVGASAAGLSAARALRSNGFDGSLTMLGAEAEPPYKRPPLSKELLVDESAGDAVIALRLNDSLDVALHTERPATRLDLANRVVYSGRTGFPFDGLVIATGATPVHPWRDAGLDGVFVLRTVADARALRARMVTAAKVAVVGAGFIGAEVASAARQLGRSVVVIDAVDTPFEQTLGRQVGAALAGLHTDNGTQLRLGAQVVRLEGEQAVRGVRLASGELVEADLVVVGVGVRPATDWLDGSGVHLADGVVCDAGCGAVDDSGDPIDGVVAAGDVARWHNPVFDESMRVEHWDNSMAQGKAAALRLLGHGEPYAPVPYFWSDQYGIRIRFAGSARPGDDVVIVEGDIESRSFVAAYGRDGRTVGVVTVDRSNRLGHYRKLIWPPSPFPPADLAASASMIR